MPGQKWAGFSDVSVVRARGLPVPPSTSSLSLCSISPVPSLPCSCPFPQFGSGRRAAVPAVRMTRTWMWRVCGDDGAGSPAHLGLGHCWMWRTRPEARVPVGSWASPSTCASLGPWFCWAWGSSSSPVSGPFPTWALCLHSDHALLPHYHLTLPHPSPEGLTSLPSPSSGGLSESETGEWGGALSGACLSVVCVCVGC